MSLSAIQFVYECYKIHETCVTAADTRFLYLISDQYKIQEMFDKAVDDFLTELKFVSDWFVTGNMIKELEDDLFANDDIIFFGRDSVM